MAQILLLAGVSQAVVTCLKPSGTAGKSPTPPVEDPHQPEDPGPVEQEEGPGLTFSEWQRIRVKFELGPDRGPRPSITGFDKVAQVFGKQVYGPCSFCHTHEWPYLPQGGDWSKFLASIGGENHGISTKEDLGALLVGCVDPTSEGHCSGDPDDASDNLDFKMPSKFGYDAVATDDLTILNTWLEDGVQELSYEARDGLRASDLVTYEIEEPTGAVEVRVEAGSLVQKDKVQEAAFDVRFSDSCVDVVLMVRLKDGAGAVVATAALTLLCQGSTFASDATVQI